MGVFDPIEMPSPLPVNSKAFDLNFEQDMTPAGRGFIQVVETTAPMWVAQYSTPALNPVREQEFQAFLDELEGSKGCFLAYDPRRPRLFAYRNTAGEPWVDNPVNPPRVASADYGDSKLSLDRLAVGTVFTKGDYIAYKRVNAWYLHRVRTGGIVGVGKTIDLIVTPRPFDSSTPVVARLEKACCAMKLLGKPDKQDRVEDVGPQYKINAIQFVDRSTD